MNPHALDVLEFPRVLSLVAGRATTELGAERVRALAPSRDREWLEAEHRRVAAVRAAIQGDAPWHPAAVPDVRQPIARLRVIGLRWTGPELLAAAQLLRSSRTSRESLRDERRPPMVRAVLAPIVDRLLVSRAEEDAIERTLLDDGSVKDDASPALRRIRRELRAAHGELVRILERAMARLESQHRVPDASVTVRNGRFVIPVRRAGGAEVGGIVHDVSQSGGTLFVEPPAAIEFGNRMRELEIDEQEEVDRILLALTDRLRPHREALGDTMEALAELDALFARARYANAFGCTPAEMVPARQGFAINHGRHPLLLAQAREDGRDVVPFDLEMAPGERTLLVSGPNTGGKTVLLKAVGLFSAMMQAGIPAPVGAESRIAIFDDAYADIGDEQSIEASLSTFSAHLKNLGEILRLATGDSLVLVDELGSGTDPVEGAALGWSILEELTRRGVTTIASTHLGALKELPTQVPGVVNASLQFDAVALAPTYRLIKGVPGRSYGISIARRLALPAAIVDRAEERLPQQERDLAALVEQLETREEELDRLEQEARAIADDARRRIQEVIRREERVRTREREAERNARLEARRYLLDARGEIDRTIKELKKKQADAVEAAGREARRKAEALAQEQGSQLERLEREERNAARRTAQRAGGSAVAPRQAEPLGVGDTVEVGTLGGKVGRIVELRGKEALVTVGALRLTVDLRTLRRTEAAPVVPAGTPVGDLPEVEASTEIDLRGMRPDEIDAMLLQALDAAIRADLPAMRIIHGKGTGALRDRVAELLTKEARVRNFRLGAWNEGGNGVTVAEFA